MSPIVAPCFFPRPFMGWRCLQGKIARSEQFFGIAARERSHIYWSNRFSQKCRRLRRSLRTCSTFEWSFWYKQWPRKLQMDATVKHSAFQVCDSDEWESQRNTCTETRLLLQWRKNGPERWKDVVALNGPQSLNKKQESPSMNCLLNCWVPYAVIAAFFIILSSEKRVFGFEWWERDSSKERLQDVAKLFWPETLSEHKERKITAGALLLERIIEV